MSRGESRGFLISSGAYAWEVVCEEAGSSKNRIVKVTLNSYDDVIEITYRPEDAENLDQFAAALEKARKFLDGEENIMEDLKSELQ